ncbi:transposable element Tc1 transposase [Trichonephila clavipes]|nr:transposable element Tc1 transposase [Trichonephila clavipes]
MRVWKHRTPRKTGSGRRKMTSARDDCHPVLMAVNDCSASSWKLTACWATATGILMSASSIRRCLLHCRLRARVRLYKIPLTENYRRLRLQWAQEHRVSEKLISTKLSFQMNQASMWWTMMAAFVYVREVLQPEVIPFLQSIHGAILQQNNAQPHVAKTVRDFCLAQHMQLLPSPAYSLDIPPIEHVLDLVGRCLARARRNAPSEDELLLRIQVHELL